MASLLLLLLLLLSSGAAAADEPQQAALTDLLSATNGCRGFAALVAATPKVSGVLQSHFAGGGCGLTVFCPDDKAVAAFAPTFHNNLSADGQAALLLYHGVGAGISEKALRAMAPNGAVLRTLAATNDDDGGRASSYYEIAIVFPSQRPPGAARVAKTAVDEARIAVHIIDAVMPVPTTAATCSGFVLMNRVCVPDWAVALLAGVATGFFVGSFILIKGFAYLAKRNPGIIGH